MKRTTGKDPATRGEEVAVPPRSLPENPSLENLKNQAKRLRRAVRDGDPESLARVREFHPRTAEALAAFSLSDAQLVTARAYGFASWPKLKQHLEVVARYRFDPLAGAPGGAGPDAPADALVRLACLNYGEWHPYLAEKARQMLSENPELARANISTAATVGDVSTTRAMLA
ncbi:MAG: hypothetical protein WAU32_13400, partial [Thermoanaerobaculia bacterium]